jgi:hypothetical protein
MAAICSKSGRAWGRFERRDDPSGLSPFALTHRGTQRIVTSSGPYHQQATVMASLPSRLQFAASAQVLLVNGGNG